MSEKLDLIESGLRHGRRSFSIDNQAETDTIIKEYRERNWEIDVLEEGGQKFMVFHEKGERKILKG